MEPLSLDEAYLDITSVLAAPATSAGDRPEPPLILPKGGRPGPSAAGALQVAIALKHRVKAETGLSLSVGVGTGKSVAKIASDLGKPDGLVVVQPGQEREFLAPLPVARL